MNSYTHSLSALAVNCGSSVAGAFLLAVLPPGVRERHRGSAIQYTLEWKTRSIDRAMRLLMSVLLCELFFVFFR